MSVSRESCGDEAQGLEAFTQLLSASVLEHPPYEVTLAAACELAFLKKYKHLSLNDIEAAARTVCLSLMRDEYVLRRRATLQTTPPAEISDDAASQSSDFSDAVSVITQQQGPAGVTFSPVLRKHTSAEHGRRTPYSPSPSLHSAHAAGAQSWTPSRRSAPAAVGGGDSDANSPAHGQTSKDTDSAKTTQQPEATAASDSNVGVCSPRSNSDAVPPGPVHAEADDSAEGEKTAAGCADQGGQQDTDASALPASTAVKRSAPPGLSWAAVAGLILLYLAAAAAVAHVFFGSTVLLFQL